MLRAKVKTTEDKNKKKEHRGRRCKEKWLQGKTKENIKGQRNQAAVVISLWLILTTLINYFRDKYNESKDEKVKYNVTSPCASRK